MSDSVSRVYIVIVYGPRVLKGISIVIPITMTVTIVTLIQIRKKD